MDTEELASVVFDGWRASRTPRTPRPIGAAVGGTAGLLEGNPAQFLNQCIGVVTVFVYDAVVSLIILAVVKMFVGLRVAEDAERDGLDIALHGEVVH